MHHSQDTRLLQHFMDTWPIRVLYQHQGIGVSTWLRIRSALGSTMGVRVVKGSQLSLVCSLDSQPETRVYLQGSCCVFGVSRFEDIAHVSRLCALYPNTMVLLGGHWENQYWTHLDINHVAQMGEMSLLHGELYETLLQGLGGIHTCMEHSQRGPMEVLFTSTGGILSLLPHSSGASV